MITARKIILIGAGVILAGLFEGCRPQYGIANGGAEPIYFEKPVYRDSAVTACYIGGKYAQTIDSAYSNNNERSRFGEIYFHRSHTKKFYNLSYGAFGYMGSYKVAVVEKYRGEKSFYGGGVAGSFNLNIPTAMVDFRPIGVSGSFLYEDGDFASFRRKAEKENLIDNLNSGQFVYNLSLTTEYVLKFKHSSLGILGSLGSTMNTDEDLPVFTLNGCVHYSYKDIAAYVQGTHYSWGIGNVISVGLSYRIK